MQTLCHAVEGNVLAVFLDCLVLDRVSKRLLWRLESKIYFGFSKGNAHKVLCLGGRLLCEYYVNKFCVWPDITYSCGGNAGINDGWKGRA
jgi:hypothetical protein